MKSTRKWIAAIMAVLMLVLMAACGNGGNAANENKAGVSHTGGDQGGGDHQYRGYSPIRTPLAMWMKTASIRATMCTLPGGWRRIRVLR